MLRAQEMYGPHDGRTWSADSIALGRRLYRLLPEDIHDRQPVQSRDGRLTLVADIRLDNRDELTPALGLSADEARKLCDADIALLSFERWGEDALDRLIGDFALAIWNARDRKLLLARDPAGRRPLHYHRGRGFFAFASMPKGLHALADVPYAPDEETVEEILAVMPRRGPRTCFKDIHRVERAHVVTITRDNISTRRFWTPQRPSSTRLSVDDYVDGLRHHLDQAVQCRLRGAGDTLGSDLSAGYDSGAVTTTAARLVQPSGRVIAFTAVPAKGYAGPAPRNRFNDEGPLAAQTAALYPNIEHVLVFNDNRSPLDALDRRFFLFEEPVVNAGNLVWAHAINQAARERKLHVVLTGGMGNMTISYDGLELFPELLRRGRLLALAHTIAQATHKTSMTWRGALAKALGPFTPAPLWAWLNATFAGGASDPLHYTAMRAERRAAIDETARTRDLDLVYRPWADGFAMRRWVLERGDPGNVTKGFLGGWGIDRRDPTTDRRLIEFSLSIPTEAFMRDGEPRALARLALGDRLPQAVLNEQRRGYQAADWHVGLTAARGEVADELERIAACAPAAQVLDIERMKKLVDNWPSGGWEKQHVQQAYRLALLRGIAAGHFLRKASGGNR